MAYTIERIESPAQPTLVVRTRSPVEHLNAVLGTIWGQVMTHADAIGAVPSGPPFVGYHNRDMSDLDLEVGFPFAQAVRGHGDVAASEIPATPAVQTVHRGPYETLNEAYEALRAWLDEHGLAPAGPAYEHYLNDPTAVEPEDLLTRIVWPIAQRP